MLMSYMLIQQISQEFIQIYLFLPTWSFTPSQNLRNNVAP